MDHKTAALLFYALQTASTNLSRTTFEPRPQQVVIDPRGVPDTSLGDDAWYKEEFTENDQEEAETNEEPAADSPATVNIQAMAESRIVGSRDPRAPKHKESCPPPPASHRYQAKFDLPHFGLDPPILSASPPHS